MKQGQKIRIFDTTLRDGQQCPGAGMSFEKNIEYAKLVSDLRLDVIEAGFPSASELDFQIVKAIAELYASQEQSPIVAGLCQLREEQVEKTIAALEPVAKIGRGLLHTYVPVAPELMKASLGEKADKTSIQKDVFAFVKTAVEAGLEVEFSPEGYSRQGENFDFTTDLIRAAVEAGAHVINCPDTIGGASEFEGEDYFVAQMNRHAEIIASEYPERELIWSAHCHNDLGLAVQNSVNAAFRGPARQIEGCINGVGERAGNVALESVIMVIRQFGATANPEAPYYTDVEIGKLQGVCDFISKWMLPRQPHWPVSGSNAAKHSSGGHTNAVLKNPMAYQPFDPREIGKDISFLFGPLSGGNHAKAIVEEAGYRCENQEKAEIAQYIKNLYKDRRKGITDEELLSGYFDYRSPIKISSFNYSRSADQSSVELEGVFFDQKGDIRQVHQGRDSALAALKKLADAYLPTEIQSHKSESASVGFDAKSVSRIVVTAHEGELFEGIGEDQDIEISAMKALINAVNQAYIERNFKVTTESK